MYALLTILVLLWAIGVVAHVGGNLIHLFLVVAVILLAVKLLTGRVSV